MTDVVVPDSPSAELERRTIRRSDWVACNSAFIDCRTPGSDRKENYAFIGAGVSQNANQFVNLTENHGFNLGAAGMPNGVTNNLHLHFTAEVFINFGGTFRLRWGVDGKQGEYVSNDGDIISVPTWIFRGFTNEGPDDGILLTVLGQDVTGGIIWGPSVLNDAKSYGLYLTADNRLIDTVAGDELPTDVELIKPMQQRYIDELTPYTRRGVPAAGHPAGRPGLQLAGAALPRSARRWRRPRAGDRLRHVGGPAAGTAAARTAQLQRGVGPGDARRGRAAAPLRQHLGADREVGPLGRSP